MNQTYPTLNEFERKCVIVELSEFDILSMKLRVNYLGGVSYYFFIMHRGFVFAIDNVYYDNSDYSFDKSVSKFLSSSRNKINEEIKNIEQFIFGAIPLKKCDIASLSVKLSMVITSQLNNYSCFKKMTCFNFGPSIYSSSEGFYSMLLKDMLPLDIYKKSLEDHKLGVDSLLKIANDNEASCIELPF